MKSFIPIYAKTLLLQGSSTTGTFVDGFFFVEEKIRIKDASQLFDFCKWIDQNVGGGSSANIDLLFSAFKNPSNQELQNQVKEIADKIFQIKSIQSKLNQVK